MTTGKKKVTVYLPDQIYDDAWKLAEVESRTMSNMVEVLIKRAIAQAKSEGLIGNP
jgi:hypothetical protein